MNFRAYWQSEYPTCPPIPHLLRDAFPERWVRFHSLPASKRYAENEAESQIILLRQNAILDQLAPQNTPLFLVTTEFGGSTISTRLSSPLVTLDLSAHCNWTLKADDDDNHFSYLFVSEWKWKLGIFDPILRLIADGEIVESMIVCPTLNWNCHFYDGGADLILPSSTSRDHLRSRFFDWLPNNPSGL